jgi:S-disulfanyl-L-cysteine oxidoreductase SoxD
MNWSRNYSSADASRKGSGKRGRVAAGAFALAMIFAAGVPAAHAFPWSIDMFRGAAIQPLEVAPRVMPDGVLPVDGIHYNNHPGQPDGLPGADDQAVPQMKLEAMTVKMHNPLQATPENLKHGEQLFLTDCSPCHGIGGAGDGSVVHLLVHKPANLMTGVSKNLPDGYIYGYIRNGGIWMPSYNDAMNSTERWQVVVYLRDMQEHYQGAPASTAAATSSPSSSTSSDATVPRDSGSSGGSSGAGNMPGMNMSH